MKTVTRFAPSPTGFLHVGNIRTALICWLYARQQGGEFILRLDDTDVGRSTQEFADAIKQDLTWLGLSWDNFFRQSDRLAQYELHINKLKANGRLYPCYETPEELALKRKALLNAGKPPIYDRGALKLTEDDKARLEAEGRRPHWRFLMQDEAIDWDDLIRGPVHFNGRDISDPVLIREDGTPLYHLCSVIDDVDYHVTHIVRGEDHVANTAAHIQMFKALGANPPQFAHLALVSGADGDKLSKRIGALSMRQLRDEEGLEPLSVMSLLAKLGSSDAIELRTSLDDLIADFDFGKFSRSSARLDAADIYRLNEQLIHTLSFDAVKDRLAALGAGHVDAAFWLAVRGNLKRLVDISEWQNVLLGSIQPVIDEPDYTADALALLPGGTITEQTWQEWVNALKDKTGRKGKALFMPLRLALTGIDHGPEMAPLLPILGRDKITQRLQGIAA